MKTRKPHGYWTEEQVRETASEYEQVSHFKKDHSGGYIAACRYGIVSELFPDTIPRGRKPNPAPEKPKKPVNEKLKNSLREWQHLFD